MRAILRRLLGTVFSVGCTLAGCGVDPPAPIGTTGGQSGQGGAGGSAPPYEGGPAGGAGGAGSDVDAASDGAGGRAGCAGFVSFADPNVERAAVQFFDAGPVLAEHARHVDVLRIHFTPDEPLTSLKGLECFTGLRRLDIGGPDLPSWGLLDLSPLTVMESLSWLEFYFDSAFGRDFGPWPHVLDLSPIAKLTMLRTVRFDINAVQDITALGSLVFTTSLVLYSDTLSDLSPLAKLTGVGTVSVRGKSITDIAPLAAALASAGVRVMITNTSVADVSPLAAVKGARGLSLNDNLITDIGPLIDLPAITSLDVTGNPLDCPTQMVHIDALRARGVRVTHGCP